MLHIDIYDFNDACIINKGNEGVAEAKDAYILM